MGILYYEKGRNFGHLEKDIDAIGSLKKALSYFKEDKNKKFIAKTNLLLGNSNAYLERKEIALAQLENAIKIFKKIDDKKGEANALNALAHVQYQFGNIKKSIKYLKKASNIQLELDDMEALSASYNNIGFVFEETKNYVNAKKYYKKAIRLNRKTNRLNSNPLRNLGAVYLLENKLEKCRLLYLDALVIENKANRLSIQKEIYDVLLDVSIKDKGFKNSSLYIVKRDSINNLLMKKENKEKIKLVEDQYVLIAREKELKQEKSNNNKNKLIFVIITGLLSFIGLFLFQKSRNSKLKLNQEKLVLEQKVLRSQMNPHFIFNALTAIQKSLLDEDLLKSSTYLSRFAKLIRQNFEFTSRELIFLDEDLNALKNYIETQQLRFEDKFDYEINIEKGMDITYIKIPPMLLQPFVENAIEHGLRPKKEKGNLILNVFESNNLVHFEIIDDGVGFKNKKQTSNREHANGIFYKRLKLRGLHEEKSFMMESLENGIGVKISFSLKI